MPWIIERKFRFLKGEAYTYDYLTDQYLTKDIYKAKTFSTQAEALAYQRKRRLIGQGGWQPRRI